jgi:AcrR family transcriptional regulator
VSARTALKPRKKPRQARSRQTLDAILVAAAQVFERRGYAAGTTDAIAERAGVSVGSVYQYFPNKDAILVALVERHLEEGVATVSGLLREAREEPVGIDSLLRRFADAMIALHQREPRLHRVLFEEIPLPASLRRTLERREEIIAEEVAELITQRLGLAVRDPSLVAYMLVHSVEGLVHDFILHPPRDLDAAAFADELVRMLHSYLEGATRSELSEQVTSRPDPRLLRASAASRPAPAGSPPAAPSRWPGPSALRS